MNRLSRLLPLRFSSLGPDYLKLVSVHFCFLCFSNLQLVFFNTLLLRVSGNQAAMLYNIITFVFIAFSYILGVNIIRRFSAVRVLQAGIAVFVLMYVVMLLTMEHFDVSMPVVGILNGVGSGLYWVGNAFLLTAYTRDEARDAAMSLSGIVNGVSVLTMPLLAGYIISRFTGLGGYLIVFSLALCVSVAAVLVTRTLPAAEADSGDTDFRLCLRLVRRESIYRLTMLADCLKSFREGVMKFFMNMLLYGLVTNEMLIGVNTFLVGAAGIMGAFFYGRLVHTKNRVQVMYTALSSLTLLIAILMFRLTPWTILIFSIANGFISTFLINPSLSIVYQVCTVKEMNPMRGEYLTFREFMLAAGKSLGVVFVMLMPHSSTGYIISLFALTALQYVTVTLYRSVTIRLGAVSAKTEPPFSP